MGRRSIGTQAGEALDVLSERPTKRDRAWEQKQRNGGHVVTYRGIPADLQARIKEIASDQQVNIGEVARRFLEFALDAYQSGALVLKPAEKVTKKTLYPDDL